MLNWAVFFKALHHVLSLLKMFQKNLFWEQPLYQDRSLARKQTCDLLLSCLTHTPYSIYLLRFDLMRLSCIKKTNQLIKDNDCHKEVYSKLCNECSEGKRMYSPSTIPTKTRRYSFGSLTDCMSA